MNDDDEILNGGDGGGDESFHAGETPVDSPSLASRDETGPGSILDLLQKGDDDVIEAVPESEDVDLDAVDGKSLQDILRSQSKLDSSWKHETLKDGAELPGADEVSGAPKRKFSKLIVFVVLAGASGIFLAIFSLISGSNEEGPAPAPALSSRERMKIPSMASDSTLASFYSMARGKLAKKKIKDAEFILKQLNKHGWRKWLVWGGFGECAIARSDKEKARKYLEDALKSAPVSLKGDDCGLFVHFSVLLASLLKEEGDFKGVAAVLGRAEKYLGGDDGEIWASLAEARVKISEKEKALEALDHVKPSEMTKEQMRLYASLLESVGRRKDAFGVYLSLARGGGDTDAFDKAELLAPDSDSRIAVLMEAASKRKGTPKGEGDMVNVGKLLLEKGRTNNALSILIGVNVRRLGHGDARTFLMMLPHFKDSKVLVAKCHDLISKYYSRNTRVQKQLRDELVSCGEADFCHSFFLEEWRRRPNMAEANYMRALVEPSSADRKRYLEKALDLNPGMYEALFDYGVCLLEEGDLKGAEARFRRCVSERPMARQARRYLAIVRIRSTRAAAPLQAYERFLRESRASDQDIAKEMVLLARYLPDDREENKWLDEAEKFPELSSFVEVERLRSKLARGSLTDADFKGKTLKGEIRKLYMIYLAGEGRLKELLLIPSRKEDFPEFWKVYAARGMGLKSWRRNANLIVAKRPDNILEVTCAKLWLGEISPEDAENILDAVPHEDKPLLLAVIADRLRTLRKWNQVGRGFSKALKYGNPNIYVKVIRRIMKH